MSRPSTPAASGASRRAATPDWRPRFGAWPEGDGVRFSVWAPRAQTIHVRLQRPDGPIFEHPLAREAEGVFAGRVAGARAGDHYWLCLNGSEPRPDPASRFQPDGVHGPSAIVDPHAFAWRDEAWSGPDPDALVFYELHVGTFSPAGTFAGVTERLPYLRELGVTAVELMPVADFAGRWNWGYDGVCPFAPARCYGRPDDLRQLVDTAHGLGLAVFLDVVYNHLGPDGAYLGWFSPEFFSARHQSPWGAGINLDGPHSETVRAFIVDNALHWIHEYHVDGLRLDATHALADDSPTHVVAELAERVHAITPRRLVVAEDHRNLAVMLVDRAAGGWGLDGVWADDFHHQMRRLVAGDADGYYVDFSGTLADLARTIRQGWFFTGQYSQYLRERRGTDPSGIPRRRFVICLQNHDQVGNRAFGERLHHQVAPAAFRAATAVLLLAPETPLVFMGQEWAASTPFLYFTDHNEELGRLVTKGRRKEFGRFAAFADPEARERIPDPQAASTLQASRLDWTERETGWHQAMWRLHRALLQLRREEPALGAGQEVVEATALGSDTLIVRHGPVDGRCCLVVARLRGAGEVDLTACLAAAGRGAQRTWDVVLTTEDAAFADRPAAPAVDLSGGAPVIRFDGPAAVILRTS